MIWNDIQNQTNGITIKISSFDLKYKVAKHTLENVEKVYSSAKEPACQSKFSRMT